MRCTSAWIAVAIMGVSAQPARADLIGQADPIVERPDDGLREELLVPMLDEERLVSLELVAFTYREDKGLGLVTRIEGVDGCRFRATLWEFAPAVGMSRDRTCDWSVWLAENTRMTDPDVVLPFWELPEYLNGFIDGGHYDPDGGDGPPGGRIPSLKDRIGDEVVNVSDCALAAISLAGSGLVCGGSTYIALGFGGPTNPVGAAPTAIAIGSCILAAGSLAAVLEYCYGLPMEGFDMEGLIEYLQVQDMLVDVADVQDFMEFMDLEQFLRGSGLLL